MAEFTEGYYAYYGTLASTCVLFSKSCGQREKRESTTVAKLSVDSAITSPVRIRLNSPLTSFFLCPIEFSDNRSPQFLLVVGSTLLGGLNSEEIGKEVVGWARGVSRSPIRLAIDVCEAQEVLQDCALSRMRRFASMPCLSCG